MRVHLPQAAESDGEALEVLVWSLPGRHWKWRMHASALSLVERMMSDWEGDWIPDGFLVTDMMDVGQFRAALPSRMRQVPIVLYFHEINHHQTRHLKMHEHLVVLGAGVHLLPEPCILGPRPIEPGHRGFSWRRESLLQCGVRWDEAQQPAQASMYVRRRFIS